MLLTDKESGAACLPDMSQYAAIDLAFCHSWNPSGRTTWAESPEKQRRNQFDQHPQIKSTVRSADITASRGHNIGP